jgi:hypothetical protein
MNISAIDRELLKYVTQMDELQKRSLLELIKTFLNKKEAAAETTSLQQYNQELEAAMERISKGTFTSLEDLEKEMQSW